MTIPETPEPPDRNPLRRVAKDVSLVVGIIGTSITSAVGFGIVTAAEADAVKGLLGTVPGLLAGLCTLLAAFSTARSGEQHVTPLADPRTNAGVPLVPDTSLFNR